MTRWFAVAAIALWLLFVVQAVLSPILLDDWFQLRYWRDHAFGAGALWELAHYNYFHYNPRIGEVWLAVVHAAAAIHWILTPLVQLALLPIAFAIAFARWPRRTARDLELLLFIQVMIWLVIPLPGIMYFYRPFATNYLWAFTCTLALFVPYRLAGDGPRRWWAVPPMLALGWTAGMCNEHTGPTAIAAMIAFLVANRRRLRAWMFAGAVGLCVGYPMLMLAPGQRVRYAGLAQIATPTRVIAERGVTGCLAIVWQFIYEARLGLVFALAIAVVARVRWPRQALVPVVAALAIVVTLFASPKATDRVFFASAVLLVIACAIGAARAFADPLVRRFAIGASVAILAFHVVRFVTTAVETRADNDARIALLAAAPPGTIAVVPAYRERERTRWTLGDDFLEQQPWLGDYVATQLYDLAGVDLEQRARGMLPRAPTYRELQRSGQRGLVIPQLGLPLKLPVYVEDGSIFIDGSPFDLDGEHFIRVRGAPANATATYVVGCGDVYTATPRAVDGALLVPVDERFCRGILTAVMCARDRCWVAGWY